MAASITASWNTTALLRVLLLVVAMVTVVPPAEAAGRGLLDIWVPWFSNNPTSSVTGGASSP